MRVLPPTKPRPGIRFFVLFLPLLVVACAGSAVSEEDAPKTQGRVPTKPAKEAKRVAGSWVVISHSEVENALESGKARSKEDAKKRADEALAKARNPEVKFADVVAEYTDFEPSRKTGGAMGRVFSRGEMPPAFKAVEDAIFGMEIGQVSAVVESPLGFHVIMRDEIIEYAAAHILLQYKGSQRAKPTVTRTKDEAKKRAEELVLEARKEGADFAELAKKNSDGPSGPKGGLLGNFGPGQMVPAFETAVSAISVGTITGPVETPFGFHVIKRTKPEVPLGASHILISHKDSSRPKPTVTRTKEEAKKLADEIHAEAIKEGADFAELAKKHSDGPSAPRGGDLGTFEKGRMVPAFEEAVFALKVGEVSKPVETQFGFHVILRTQ